MLTLDNHHLADLRKSGLSDETIEAAGIHSIRPADLNRTIGFNIPSLSSAYGIPYPGCDGFERYRCFYEGGKTGPKYLQKKGTGNHLYISPLAASISADPTKPLYITEGEKKALKACQENIPCIGLSGLWNWKIRGGGLITDFEKIALQDRRVFIVPDNDYQKPNRHGYKKNLQKAVNDLAGALPGCVAVVKLPNGPAKGLDDYLCNHTITEFHQLPVKEVQPLDETPQEKKKRESKTDKLIKLALSAFELFHDKDLKAYATIKRDNHHETYSLRSKTFRTCLSGLYWTQYGEGIGGQIMQDAIGTLEGHAIHGGACHAIHIRLAENGGTIFLDLGNARHEVVEISPDGWRVLDDQNIVKFRRPSGMAALPYPREGGDIELLRKYVNLSNADDWPVLIGYLLMCFNPRGPYPILSFTGEQGSAKSTGQKVIKAITDPSTAPLRSLPKEIRDLAITSMNTFLLAFDNLSDIPGWMSDALCRQATGGGFATRTLYSDDEETIINTRRPIMMNGIDNIVRRHDLADRSIIINLAVIPEDKRIAEADFWREFEDDAPEILGATLDAVSCSLRKFRTIHLPRVPRMADFAIWVTAAEQALGWKDGTFLNAYAMNRREVNAMTLDADLVGTAVKAFMEGRGYETWEGTATELLNILDDESEERTKKSRGWPHSSNSLSGKLRRAATALRAEGIEITTGSDRKIVQDGEHKKQRFIRLEQVAKKIVPIVPGMDTNAQAIDFTENNCRTMLEDKIVPESFPRSGDRSRWDDVRDDRNDGRKKIVPETGKKRPVKTGGCKSGNDGDDGDDDFSPPFQNELREGII